MKKPLLFLASLALWIGGGIVLWLLGNIYVNFAHPDGLSYGKFMLREVLFGVPDVTLFFAPMMLYAGVVLLSPYRKITGVLLFLQGAYYIIKPFTVSDFGSSAYIQVLTCAWMMVMGIAGFFGKSYDETNLPPATIPIPEAEPEPKLEPSQSPQPKLTPAQLKGARNLMALLREAKGLPPLPKKDLE